MTDYNGIVFESELTAEDCSVQQIHFAPGLHVHVFRAAVARHHHHIVRVKTCILNPAVASNLNRSVANCMDVLRHAAAAHDQSSAVFQRRFACQTAVRYHLTTN